MTYHRVAGGIGPGDTKTPAGVLKRWAVEDVSVSGGRGLS